MQMQTVWAGGYVPPVRHAPKERVKAPKVVRELEPLERVRRTKVLEYLRVNGPSTTGAIAVGINGRHSTVHGSLVRMLHKQVLRDGFIWRLPSETEVKFQTRTEQIIEWLQKNPESSMLEIAAGLNVPRTTICKAVRRLEVRGIIAGRKTDSITKFTAREGVEDEV